MFYIFSGDKEQIDKELVKLATVNSLPIRYVIDIQKEPLYGLMYTPALLYFIYDDSASQLDFIKQYESSDSIVVCIADKLTKQIRYKYNKYIHLYYTKQPKVKPSLSDIYTIEDDKVISYLYASRYSNNAGLVANLILTSKITNIDVAKKLFIFLSMGY